MASEVQLIYTSKVKSSERPYLRSVNDAYEILLKHWDKDKIDFIEQAKALFLNNGHRVLGLFEISSGGVSATVIDPKLLFTAALKLNASTIILAHNHPSGNLQPSESDKQLTEKIKQAGRLLDIKVIDHIILTREGYYSFANEGLL